MGKTKRGNNIKKPGWRGTCPVCHRTGVKLLWTKLGEDGKTQISVCKVCGNKQ